MRLTRRPVLAALTAQMATMLLPHGGRAESRPDRMVSTVVWQDGRPLRRFSGAAAPPENLRDPRSGTLVRYHAAFPNPQDPFAIDTGLRLGPEGLGLQTQDRGLDGRLPEDAAPWRLNMVPFGVARDGVILDPSGPWYDGGPADPNNPFDRACSGWEYEVTDPRVAALVGMPEVIRGHVQPSGMFHYHGYPAPMIAALRAVTPETPLVVGYAADGYPILDHHLTGPDGRRVLCVSGYVLRAGPRHSVPRTNPGLVPEGAFDGLFVQDYIYDPEAKRALLAQARAEGVGWFGHTLPDDAAIHVLDRRNGLVLGAALDPLPGYPHPHYTYVLTPDWPEIPRLFAFEPDDSFKAIIPLERSGLGARIAALLGQDGAQGRRALYDSCGTQAREIRDLPKGRAPY